MVQTPLLLEARARARAIGISESGLTWYSSCIISSHLQIEAVLFISSCYCGDHYFRLLSH